MSKSLSEYKRFLVKSQAGFSEYEKKLARLVLDNFAAVEACGTAGGRRGKLIAKLIVDKGDAASGDLDFEADAAPEDAGKIIRLSSIKVQNFRGFSVEHTLEFKNLYTFVYGPNGTGKSSLCEALEYGLLGSINEADAKRIDVATYIRNSITRKSDLPVLLGVTADGKKNVQVKADPKNYEFCFIEKNRIDGFARVAANTASTQQARLAALFGLDEFNGFATQFNDHFENYIDVAGQKSKELADKEKQIAGQKAILLQVPEKDKEVKGRQDAVLAKYPAHKTLDELREWVAGPDGNSGTVKANHVEIARLNGLKPIPDPSVDAISAEVTRLSGLIEERRATRLALAAYKDQLSLGELYSAILKNQEKTGDKCPACESALYVDGKLVVPVDPYRNAAEKLKQFEGAIKQEARINEITGLLNERWPRLASKVEGLASSANVIAFAKIPEIETLKAASESVINSKTLEEALALLARQAALLDEFKAAVVAFNTAVGKAKAEATKLEALNAELSKVLIEIVSIRTTVDLNANNARAAAVAIEKFKEDNDVLIKLVEAEKPIVTRNGKYLAAYESFREKLMKYNVNLPLALAADLNEKTLKFYNAINKHDHVSDRLKSLALPIATGQKIEIEFMGGQKCDALQVLSEGHIRCLGLAILLSKIVRDDLPFLIFDDVVNSIDDEHRGGIVDLILGDDEIRKRQLIITTHGEDFVKRLENAIPKAAYKVTVCRIDFLVPIDSKQIVVKLDSPRHYLELAERGLQDGRIRDCLSYLRKSLEEVLNRLWKKIGNKDFSAQIQVGLRTPGGSPDLMALAGGLLKFLEKKDVTVFKGVIPELVAIIGKKDTHAVEWNYLNKGTHEEERVEEFDTALVREMLASVIAIEAAIEADGTTPPVLAGPVSPIPSVNPP